MSSEAILPQNLKHKPSKTSVPSPFEPKKKRRKFEQEAPPPPTEDDMPINVSFKIIDGVRHLNPYWTLFKTRTKGRWLERPIYECFKEEFVAHDSNYSKIAIKSGRFIINGEQMTDPYYRLKNNDSICHISHRHEVVILDHPIDFIVNDENLLVVNKPPSMPVHPCAQYKIHTVIGMLWVQHKIHGLRLAHRLDRATSGVLIFTKNYETDVALKKDMENGSIRKEYVCKVEGVFPDGDIVCDQPLGNIIHAIGLHCVRHDEKGKYTKSTFRRLWTDGKNSVVSALIETGRTHQIRIHLQYLGYPILNDYIYNNTVWGPNKGKHAEYGTDFEKLGQALKVVHNVSHWNQEIGNDYRERMARMADDEFAIEPEDLSKYGENGIENRPEYDPICLYCNTKRILPDMDHMRMFLHCRRYESDKYQFEAPLPDWAIEPKSEHLNLASG